MRYLFLLLILLFAAWSPWLLGAAPGNPALEAKTVWEAAQSRYGDRKWSEAAELLEQFISKYGSNEYVPAACVQLAHCRQQLKQTEQAMAPLDEAIKRFYGSRFWLYAQGTKLTLLRDAKQNDAYVAQVQALLQKTDTAPWILGGVRTQEYWEVSYPWGNWRYWPDRYLTPDGAARNVPAARDWALDLAKMADSPERAAKALKSLQKTLQRKPEAIPVDWQFAHAALLRQSGELEKGDTLFQSYLSGWGKDPRAAALLLFQAEHLANRRDDAGADAVWEQLVRDFSGYGNLEEPMYQRLRQLTQAGRYEPFAKLAGAFVKTYTTGKWDEIFGNWVAFAQKAGEEGNPAPASDALAALGALEEARFPYLGRQALGWKLRLYTALNKGAEAGKIAEQMLDDQNWSAQHYELVEDRARLANEVSKALDAARAKYGISTAQPDAKAAELLEQLRQQIKDDQGRRAEEIGEELFEKFKSDPATIDAVRELVQHYFKKLEAEPRDKWMDRMIQAWPQHPETQKVLWTQITAETAARRYDRLAAAAETGLKNFPGADEQWIPARLGAFVSKQDLKGALEFAQSVWSKRAEAGDLAAMEGLDTYQRLLNKDDNKASGAYWSAQAKRLTGTRGEIYCYSRSFNYDYERPWWTADVQYDRALEAGRALRGQSLDPMVGWSMEFSDVNLLAHRGSGQAAAKALLERLGDRTGLRDLSYRVDFAMLGKALGQAKQVSDGGNLAKKLKGILVTERDGWATELMQASMYQAAEEPVLAARSYLTLVYSQPYPATMYPLFNTAMINLRPTPQVMLAEMNRYLKAIASAQDVAPMVIGEVGKWYAGQRDRLAMEFRSQLVAKYPASNARAELEQVIQQQDQAYRQEQLNKQRGNTR